jgi:hypothetical protein
MHERLNIAPQALQVGLDRMYRLVERLDTTGELERTYQMACEQLRAGNIQAALEAYNYLYTFQEQNPP